MALTWALALLLSFALRLWGVEHPEPFYIRTGLVAVLLVGPSVALGLGIFLWGFRQVDS